MTDQITYEPPSLDVLGTLHELTQNGSLAVNLDDKQKAPPGQISV